MRSYAERVLALHEASGDHIRNHISKRGFPERDVAREKSLIAGPLAFGSRLSQAPLVGDSFCSSLSRTRLAIILGVIWFKPYGTIIV